MCVFPALVDPEFFWGRRNMIQDSEEGGRSGKHCGYNHLWMWCELISLYSGVDVFFIPSIPGEQGNSWVGCGLPLPLGVTPLLFPRDPGQAFSCCAQFSLQLSQLCGPFHASRDGCCGCQPKWHCQPSPPAAGAVPWLIPGGGLQAQESNLECLWVKAGTWPPGPGFLGEARESSRYLLHGWNPAGYQADISEFAESHMGLGSGSGSFSGRKVLFGFMCSLPLGLLGKDKKKLLLKKPTHSFLFLVLRASVQHRRVVCGEQEEEQVSGFAHCVHGWISLPLMYLCFMKPLPW